MKAWFHSKKIIHSIQSQEKGDLAIHVNSIWLSKEKHMLPALAPTFCRHPDGCLLQSAFPTELWYYLRKQHTHLKCYISQLLCQEGRSQTKSGKWWVREAAGGCCQGSVTRHSAVLAGTGPLLSLTFHTLWPSSHSSSILWPWGDHKGQAKRIRDVHLNPSFGKLWEPGQVVEALELHCPPSTLCC